MPGQPDPRDDAKTQSPLGSAPARGRRLLVFWPGGFRELPLEDGARLTVGRATTCEVSIPDTSVSRAHAVVVGGHPCRVEDLGSANGTRVRGTQLARGGSAPLEPGTTVEIGSAMLVLQDAAVGDAVAPGVTAGAAGLDALLQRVAASTLSVLLVGETGAGKEVLALRIHRLSPRAAGPFLPLNCGALPESLLDAELFGHERGAFTGASEARAGLIESADKGTLFLDEVGEMPPSVQVKLLRVLENREVLRIGARKPRTVDVRFVAATHRDLRRLVESGELRQDLFFRLDGVTIAVPPLRERLEEMVHLAETFLADAAARAGRAGLSLDASALEALRAHPWPGNIRELKNVMERAAVICTGPRVGAADLSLGAPARPGDDRALPDRRRLSAATLATEQERILQALQQTQGNQTDAAELLGISRRTLLRRLDEYQVPRPRKG